MRKTCSYCKKRKDIKKFRRSSPDKDWYESKCKQCQYELSLTERIKWRKKNKKKVRAASRAWYEVNTEKAKLQARESRERNAEDLKEYFKKYYKKNGSKIRKKEAARREVNLNDPEFVAKEKARAAKKRKRIKNAKIPKAMPPVDNKVILDMYKLATRRNEKAGYRQFEVDHVIPISRDGFHHQDNLRVTTKRNNCGVGGKHSKLDSEWGKVPYCHYRREYYTFST